MLKDFVKKIQNLEEGDRRHLFAMLIIVSAVVVFAFWLNQIKSIFDSQSAAPKKTAEDGLPSITENIKSSAKELGQIFSGLNNHLKSQIIPEPQVITPIPPPVGGPAAPLPPAVKLPNGD